MERGLVERASSAGAPSTTVLRGRTCLRAGIVNILSSPAAVDAILERARELSPAAAREAGLPDTG